MLRERAPSSSRLTLTASKLGSRFCHQLPAEHGRAIEHKTITVVVANRAPGYLKYLDKHDSLCVLCGACKGASEGGKLDVLLWLFAGKQYVPDNKVSKALTRKVVIGRV